MYLRAASALKGTKCGPSRPDVSTWQMFHLWLGPAHGLLNSILLDRKPQTLTPPPREPSEGSLRKGHARLTWLLLQRSPRAITMWPLFTRALWAAGATGLGSCGVQKGRYPQKLLSTQIAHGVSGEGKGAMSAGISPPCAEPCWTEKPHSQARGGSRPVVARACRAFRGGCHACMGQPAAGSPGHPESVPAAFPEGQEHNGWELP